MNDGSNFSVNLSALFNDHPSGPVVPGRDHSIYYGFSDTKSISDVSVRSSAHKTIIHINGEDITATQSSSSQKYMFFWKSDDLPDVKAFKFGGFEDVWSNSKLTVDGIKGTLYVSDNKTSASSVSYEVIA